MFIQKAKIEDGQIKFNILGKVNADELEDGIKDANYVHTQDNPSDTWIVEHNLGKYPCVTVIDSGRNEVHGDVIHDTVDRLFLFFGAEFSGKAICN